MANHKGSEGVIRLGTAPGTNLVAEIRSYSISETADVLDDSSMGDTARTFLSSLKSFSGSVDVLWDETNTNGQMALTAGATGTINVLPEGTASTATYYHGAIVVTGFTINAAFDGMVEASITFTGNGPLTKATV